MRLIKLWLPAFLGLFVALAPASALPVPKLPPEVTNKPGVVIRVRPVDDLLKDIAYIAKMIGQDGLVDAIQPFAQPVIDVIDGTKPIGFYAKIGPNGLDSNGVLLVPVKNQNDVLNLLQTFGRKAVEGSGGLYTVETAAGVPTAAFRFANGYLYATVKNTPDAETLLSLNKIYPPETLFPQGDNGLFSITFNVDAMPNDLKRKGLEALEQELKNLKADQFPKVANPIVRSFVEAISEELATKVQSLIVDAQTVSLRLDFDRVKEDMGFGIRLTPRPNTDLANDINTLSSGQSLGASIIAPTSAANFYGNIAVPTSLKKALGPIIDEFVAQGWKKAKDSDQPLVKELLEALGPTMKAGILDFGVDFRGPNAENFLAMLVAVQIKDGSRLEALFRKVHGILPADKKAAIKLDVGNVAGVALHQFPAKFDPNLEAFLGADPQMIVAFRKDAIVFAIGPVTDATAAVQSAVATSPKSSLAVDSAVAINRLAPVLERKHPGIVQAAKTAYPAGVNDTYRLSVAGGQTFEFRLSASTRWILFGELMQKAQRNR
jgi:hypothetical protein